MAATSQNPVRNRRSIQLLLTISGVATLALLTVAMVARGVDQVEVIAAALYIGIFIGIVTVDVIGGAAAALAASAIYMVLRFSAIEVLGSARFAQLAIVRMLSYLAFGLIGGFAWKLLKGRMGKLENYDMIDDDTHLLNSRGMAELIDHEMARGRRYEESFAVSTVELASSLVTGLDRKRRRVALDVLGATARASVRSVDRVGVMTDDRAIVLVVLSPKTASDGASALIERVTNALSTSLLPFNVALGRKVEHHELFFPRDAVEIGQLRAQLLQHCAAEFPDARVLDHQPA
jgi:hypothetical protein